MTDSERATQTLYSCSIDIFCLSWMVKTLFHFLCLAGISLLGGLNFVVFWQHDHQNVKWEKNTCLEGTSLCQTASFEPLCVILSFSVWPVQMRKKKKQWSRKAKSKKSYKRCIFHACVKWALVADFNQTWHMCSSHGCSNLQSFIVITWEVSELWGAEFSMFP